jgi:hypothetical protein
VKRNRGAAAIWVPKLLVRPLRPNFLKAERQEFCHDFRWLEDREFAFGHRSAHLNRLRTDELRFQGGLPILEQHFDDLGEVGIEFVDRFSLGMRPRQSRNMSDVDARVGAPLDNGRIRSHARLLLPFASSTIIIHPAQGGTLPDQPRIEPLGKPFVNSQIGTYFRPFSPETGVHSGLGESGFGRKMSEFMAITALAKDSPVNGTSANVFRLTDRS